MNKLNTYITQNIVEGSDPSMIKYIASKLDKLGVEYKFNLTKNKPSSFKVIYQPINKSDDWYDKFNDIIWDYNLASVVQMGF